MNLYTFPVIHTYDDVASAFDETLFYRAEKNGYFVINYHNISSDTFPPLNDKNSVIRREFRGIIFDEAGNIIRRPLHKFFNVGERPESNLENVNVAEPHIILDKLDGSMICPFYVGIDLIWGTKMGETDVSRPVQEYVNLNKKYIDFASDYIKNGMTPIFEWCSNKQRIVLDYKTDELILTAMRNLHSGQYVKYSTLCELGKIYNIPVVKRLSSQSLSHNFIEETRQVENIEGYVVRFETGDMLKIKCDWYCQLHRVKSDIAKERGVVALILEERLDDLKPLMCKEDLEYIVNFETAFSQQMNKYSEQVVDVARDIRAKGLTKKQFALDVSPSLQKWQTSAIFSTWDSDEKTLKEDILKEINNMLLKNTNKERNYQEMRKSFSDLPVYNAKIYLE